MRAQSKFSRRAAVIALVLSALALAYAYPLRTYVEQRIEINRLEAEQEEQRDRIEELEAERMKWEDDEYVKAQIRSSLLLVEPGENLVIVQEEEDPGRTGDDESDDADDKPWYDDLVTTFEDADQLDEEEVED
ncbi:hypothetical protein GCM10028833_17610 [Glycomyces tarimensis]